MTELERLRRTIGVAASVGLALPVIARLAVPMVPLLVMIWAILSFGSILMYGRRPPK